VFDCAVCQAANVSVHAAKYSVINSSFCSQNQLHHVCGHRGAIALTNFRAVKKLSKNFILAGNFHSKMQKIEAEIPNLMKFNFKQN